MKNKGWMIALIVILLIIIIGLIIFLCFALNGKSSFGFGFRNLSQKSNHIIFDTSYEADQVDHLDIALAAGDVNIKESTDEKIRVVAYGQNEEDLNVSLDENQLKVDYSKHKRVNFGFNFYINEIVVYIPKDYAKEINLDVDYGDIEVTGLEKATIDIKEDCGDVTLGKVKNISIDNDYGDVKIEAVLNKLCMESDCGDIKINSVILAEDSWIKSDFGDVKIGNTNDIYIDAKTDLGEVDVNTNHRHSEITLKIENDCGDIKVEN